jgi:hypothetical protein
MESTATPPRTIAEPIHWSDDSRSLKKITPHTIANTG